MNKLVYAKITHNGWHPRLSSVSGNEEEIPQYLVIRYGNCDFENDGKFNETNEIIIDWNFDFINNDPISNGRNIDKIDWYYNKTTKNFQTTQP